jgi:hypothetical protein
MTNSIDQKLDLIIQSLANIEARLNGTQIEQHEGEKLTETRTTSKKLSLKEFLIERPPATDIQRTLAIGYFLENNTGITAFTRGDLEKGYADARESPPSNIGMNIQRCIKQGHLMEAEEKKMEKLPTLLHAAANSL